ncbi:MAG TPA: thioesterase family protein [Caulobacteraceae bacterium]|nr:thioesterase family protein [Caulobacteraceae bacterium]
MQNLPFFTRDGDRYVPTTVSRGPWNPNSLHGRVIAGLLGHVIEQRHGDPAFTPARLTVDMYKLPDLSPIEVTTKVVREGQRIKVVDAEFFSAGTSMARATCQLLRRTENPLGVVWSPPNWDVPAPDSIPEPEDRRGGMGGMWTTRPISGGMPIGGGQRADGPRRLWMSEVRDLAEGEPFTPFSRVAVACDFASPFANASDQGLGYINSDVSLYLHRPPTTRWVGFEAVNHHATDGVAIGECWLYDEAGPIGTATVAALAQKRSMA